MTDDRRRERIDGFLALSQEYLDANPHDVYVESHTNDAFITAAEQVFSWCSPHVPDTGRVLDWGCRHAPDAYFIRHEHGDGVELHAAEVDDPATFGLFHKASSIEYRQLRDQVEIPYEADSFDFIVAAGVLEHVPMGYESLKELNRVSAVGVQLVITFLPNRLSIDERRRRRRADIPNRPGQPHHLRRYSPKEITRLLLHTGWIPDECGYQTRLDLLGPRAGGRPAGIARRAAGRLGLRRVTSCLSVRATKFAMM
ncbi:MAG: methyltransferase domain-containing protein [Acidimicrobiales bacterium]|jgi:hypothetical protein|nr:methyltransferase domain-containing protein [Acidimicrobiales bacterium]